MLRLSICSRQNITDDKPEPGDSGNSKTYRCLIKVPGIGENNTIRGVTLAGL